MSGTTYHGEFQLHGKRFVVDMDILEGHTLSGDSITNIIQHVVDKFQYTHYGVLTADFKALVDARIQYSFAKVNGNPISSLRIRIGNFRSVLEVNTVAGHSG